MKLLCAVLLVAACVLAEENDEKTSSSFICSVPQGEAMPMAWRDMVQPCTTILKEQVKTEINASMTYLAMAAHFSKDVQNRPGFAKFFLHSAHEEREHAIKVIEYLLMRGELTENLRKLIKFPLKPLKSSWKSGVEALRDALNLEAQVTRSIRNIIQVCEGDSKNFNDYHLVDYLTGDFLGEQYHGQRDIAGKVSTLGKMMSTHGHLGEFLYDKKLLEETV